MSQPTPHPSKKASPEAQKWHEHQLEVQQKTPERLEEAAKFLSGMISISLSIFLIGDEKLFQGAASSVVVFASIAWLLSLLAALLVIFPRQYDYHQQSAESIKAMHTKVVRWKYLLLVLSAALFFMAMVVLVAVLLFSI